MKVTVCDICGKKCDDMEFNVPILKTEYITKNGITLARSPIETMTNKKINLCRQCAYQIAYFVDILKCRGE